MAKIIEKLCHVWQNGEGVELIKTLKFEDWFEKLSLKEKLQVEARLIYIEKYGHFGDAKNLGDLLFELRWRNGRRIYFTKILDEEGNAVLLLLGGNKNSQKKDIVAARKMIGDLINGKL